MNPKAHLIAEARALGFVDVRVADALAGTPGERFRSFIEQGKHADMEWLATSEATRVDPRVVFPSVRSVVVLRMDYGGITPRSPGPGFGRVASYAWGRDYHNLIGRKLKKLQARLSIALPGVRTWATIDSRPVWERAWAEAAGADTAAFEAQTGLETARRAAAATREEARRMGSTSLVTDERRP